MWRTPASAATAPAEHPHNLADVAMADPKISTHLLKLH